MKLTAEFLNEIWSHIDGISLPGKPTESKPKAAYAKAVARIVRGLKTDEWVAIDRDYAPILKGYSGDLEWLVAQITDRCEFFPKPIQVREIYETSFTPADGRSSASLRMERLVEK